MGAAPIILILLHKSQWIGMVKADALIGLLNRKWHLSHRSLMYCCGRIDAYFFCVLPVHIYLEIPAKINQLWFRKTIFPFHFHNISIPCGAVLPLLLFSQQLSISSAAFCHIIPISLNAPFQALQAIQKPFPWTGCIHSQKSSAVSAIYHTGRQVKSCLLSKIPA